MTFILSKVLWALLRPSTLLLLTGSAGLILAWLSRRRIGHTLIAVSLGGYMTIFLLPVDQWALMPLEDRFARPNPPLAHVDGIIVLRGVIDSALSQDRGVPSLTASAERITDAVILARRYPGAKLVFAGGGGGELVWNFPAEAGYAKQLFAALGLADRPIILEGLSRNTIENAVFSRAIVQPTAVDIWLLVTSASHMPRSVGIFRKIDWPVVPWPVGYKTGYSAKVQYSREFGDKLVQLDWAVHEWVGLIADRLMDRTSALFPAPDQRTNMPG